MVTWASSIKEAALIEKKVKDETVHYAFALSANHVWTYEFPLGQSMDQFSFTEDVLPLLIEKIVNGDFMEYSNTCRMQWDNARPYTARLTRDFMDEYFPIEYLQTNSYSPDQNAPVEQLIQ